MKPQHHVPRNWTAEQALAIVEWMQGFVDTLWEIYGDQLVDLLTNREPEPTDDYQPDLPF